MSAPDFGITNDLGAWKGRLEAAGITFREHGTSLRCACPVHGGDNGNALSITQGQGRVVTKCWTRGCRYEEVRALVFPELRVVEERRDSIRDIDGRTVAVHCRTKYGTGDKSMRWEQPNGASGLNGVPCADLPCYGTERLRREPGDESGDELVTVTEGEKAAEALHRRGLLAIGTVTGAASCPSRTSLRVLEGRRVVLWPDNDDEGRKHMQEVARTLRGIAAEVRVVAWPDAPPKGDAADWRGTDDDLRALLEGAPAWTPEQEKVHEAPDPEPKPEQGPRVAPSSPQGASGDELATDLGNARRIVRLCTGRLRYCPAFGWCVYDGRRWVRNAEHLAVEMAKAALVSLWDEAKGLPEAAARKAAEWAIKSQEYRRILAALSLARTDHGIHTEAERFDADPMLFNTLNGTLNLTTRTVREHDPSDLLTRLCPVEYDPQAQAQRFHAMLRRILPDPEVRGFLQRWFGYCLTGRMDEQVFAFLFGTGANGKTTLVEVVKAAAGEYAKAAAFSTFVAKRHDAIPNDLAAMAGSRAVFAPEAPQGARLNEQLLKQVVGGDTIAARFLNREWFEYAPSYKVTLVGNYRPEIKGTDDGIWRKVRLVNFGVRIPDAEQDRSLKDRILADELTGVLAWLVEGCMAWQRETLNAPPAVLQATDEYRREQDDVGRFVAERTIQGAGLVAPAASLQSAYRDWCRLEGLEPVPWKSVKQTLKALGYPDRRIKSGFVYDGLSVRVESLDEQEV